MIKNDGFSKENRVRLLYLVAELFPAPQPDGWGGQSGGTELYALDEQLRWELGRKHLVSGVYLIQDIIEEFIATAPEEELLTLIGFMPNAQIASDQESHHGYAIVKNTPAKVKTIAERMNVFLEAIGSPARFDRSFSFHRDQFEIAEVGLRSKIPKLPELEKDLVRILASHELVSLIVIDLDEFKAVNDRFGHPAGDQCLDRVVDLIGEAILRKGRLYRFREGDEFAVILRNSVANEAQATAERIRNSIVQRRPGGDVDVTASIGVASSEEPGGATAQDILKRADEAMYASKFTTKNCVTVWPVQPEVLASVAKKREAAKGR